VKKKLFLIIKKYFIWLNKSIQKKKRNIISKIEETKKIWKKLLIKFQETGAACSKRKKKGQQRFGSHTVRLNYMRLICQKKKGLLPFKVALVSQRGKK